MSTANPQHARTGALARSWQGFGRWRRARPFWGGLLIVLAGLEIFATTQSATGGLTLQTGPTGFLSWLIPTVLVACGLLIWFTPQQRLFYAVVGTVTAVFSLVAVNLGGFLIGLLLGLVGGALGFAWAPVRAAAKAEASETATAAVDRAEPADHEAVGGSPVAHDPRRGPGLPAVVLIVLTVAATGSSLHRASPAGAAPCPPAVAPSAPATPTAAGTVIPSPAPSPPKDDGNLIGDIVGGIRDLLGGGKGSGGKGSGGKGPAPTPVPSTVGPTPSVSPDARPADCAAGKPGPARLAGPVPRVAPKPGQAAVNKVPSRVTGSKVTMYGLRLDGTVDLPTADGSIRVLQFSMTKAVTDNFVLRAPGPPSRSLRFTSSALTVDGDVRFYATRFAGRILGVKVTLTPALPLPPDGIPLAAPQVSFDDPEIDLALVECDKLTAPDLDESLA